ncbi:DNA-binding protein [Rosenbergiella nectarea]|uniref:H-NS family histone-like protein n=1 Tax=Rosenbergiella nectarea TaxID=988801 RepID=UPI001BDAFFC5|nr:DNA-binding protein [Rosenbergiella nectarea]MBT0729324.1 DNA-binding protein [Rosenbergiella nectarea subsp. apis]
MIKEFHILYQYRDIQQAAATTDIKTLEQVLVKFKKVVAERRAEYYAEIGEEAARQLKMKQILEQMKKDRVCVEDLLLDPHKLFSDLA